MCGGDSWLFGSKCSGTDQPLLGPKHGYALIKDIQSFAGVTLGPGSLYGAISKLEHAGLVEAMPGEGRRKPYRITARGAADLRQLEQSEKISSVGLDRLAGVKGA